MIRTRLSMSVVVSLVVLLPATASAQVTTGTVIGSVRDATGGIIPGATVALISESRGTRAPDAVTNASGDFVFPNMTADTYTIQVTLEGFKTLKRGGVAVSPGLIGANV